MARRSAEDPAEAAAPAEQAAPFEEALARLEQIVARLERGDLPLEQALAAFKTGVALTRRCARELEDAERRIEVLVREGDTWLARPFEAAGEPE